MGILLLLFFIFFFVAESKSEFGDRGGKNFFGPLQDPGLWLCWLLNLYTFLFTNFKIII